MGSWWQPGWYTGHVPPAVLSPVRVVMSKWGGRPHWEFDATYLGSDRHGDWLGIPAGTAMDRPGAHYVAPTNQVGLVPPPGPDAERGWLATFHDVGGPVRVYVDITTPPAWDGAVVRAVDLDLDVVRGWVELPGRVGCGSTTRTSSPITGWRSATPTTWSRPRWPPASGCSRS